jgi:hypothetical protein
MKKSKQLLHVSSNGQRLVDCGIQNTKKEKKRAKGSFRVLLV